MNVLNFLNSKSVAKHLEEIDYKFSAQEAAFIVWNSNITLKEKFAAFEEIIKSMSDCAVRCRVDHAQYPSLHTFLKDYMALLSRVGEKADEEELSEEDYYLYTAFEFMWFNIPTPFKVGDIVYQGNPRVYKEEEKKEPFVLLYMESWGEAELRENGYTDEKYIARMDYLVQHHIKEGDISDMHAAGYYVDKFGRMYREHTVSETYLNLEYYDDELKGEQRVLTALSNYVQKKIDLAMLANAYRIIMDEMRIEYIKEHTCCAYFDEHLQLAGLKWKMK